MTITKLNFDQIRGNYVSVSDFGAVGDGVTDDTAAIQAAIDSLEDRGGTVFFPGIGGGILNVGYRVTSPIDCPEGIRLLGVGFDSLVRSEVVGNWTFRFGNRNSALSYNCAMEHMQIDLYGSSGRGVWLAGTASAYINSVRVQDEAPGSTVAFGVDGINISGFFNTFVNCYSLSCTTGFVVETTGTSPSTQQTFLQCSAVNGTTGWSFPDNSGQGSLILGGNIENCTTGIVSGAQNSCAVVGMRWEANTLDVDLSNVSFGWVFMGNQGIETSSYNYQNAYSQHTFFGNIGPNNTTPFPATTEQQLTMYSYNAAVVPLTVQARAGQSANLLDFKNSAESVKSGVDANGFFNISGDGTRKILWGNGTPEGVQTASVGSMYMRQDGGASTTLYIKESGAGNTGWVAK